MRSAISFFLSVSFSSSLRHSRDDVSSAASLLAVDLRKKEKDLLSESSQDQSESDCLDDSGDRLDGSVLDRSSLSKHGADDTWNGGGTEDDESEEGGTLVSHSSRQLKKGRETVSLETGRDEGRGVDGDGGLSLLRLPELGVLVLHRTSACGLLDDKPREDRL